ncbi:flavin reductase family protein [Streptomyces sp. NPDC048425]|uniref:flavin reductase family protein n=1 Tax=Streptomyces sp. NPDC048425 TaxID=3365548 RepID=UPI0037154CE8
MGDAATGSTGTADAFVDNGDLTADVLRGAYGRFPSGVTAVCGLVDGLPTGIAASSFTSVSLEPPLVSVCVAHTSTTWPVLRRAACLGVSVLAEDQGPVARALASKTSDRFTSVGWVAEPRGSVFVVGAALWLECRIVQEVPAGDHVIALLEVDRLAPHAAVAPVVFHASTFRSLARS